MPCLGQDARFGGWQWESLIIPYSLPCSSSHVLSVQAFDGALVVVVVQLSVHAQLLF